MNLGTPKCACHCAGKNRVGEAAPCVAGKTAMWETVLHVAVVKLRGGAGKTATPVLIAVGLAWDPAEIPEHPRRALEAPAMDRATSAYAADKPLLALVRQGGVSRPKAMNVLTRE